MQHLLIIKNYTQQLHLHDTFILSSSCIDGH